MSVLRKPEHSELVPGERSYYQHHHIQREPLHIRAEVILPALLSHSAEKEEVGYILEAIQGGICDRFPLCMAPIMQRHISPHHKKHQDPGKEETLGTHAGDDLRKNKNLVCGMCTYIWWSVPN